MPLIAFILLAIICLALLGFACACVSDHPAQAVERAIAIGPILPAITEVWPFALSLLLAAIAVVSLEAVARRPSEAALQRFRL
jgi:hypothetical protein